jgi:hypothetical protein
MAIEDRPGGMNPHARTFSLVPPPRDRQFRTTQLKAERSKRRAEQRRAAAFDDSQAGRAVNTAELTRLWASAAYRELRADLPPQEVEKLHCQLAAVLSGETSLKVWHATIAALREARRAADLSADARPRKWRQSYPDLNGW